MAGEGIFANIHYFLVQHDSTIRNTKYRKSVLKNSISIFLRGPELINPPKKPRYG